jgi:transmembrane sensor
MELNIPWPLIAKFLQHELLPHELLELEYWRNSSDLRTLIYEEIITDKHLQEAIAAGKWNDTSREWKSILNRIETPVKQFSIARRKLGLAFAAAATILILLSVSLGFFYTRYHDLQTQQANRFTYIYSPRGHRTRIILPDSTRVWLNSESSLRYATNYNTEIREVTTEGEAFFQVHKDPKKPFYVITDEIKVKVYGTSFNIRAFAGENRIETTLIEGKLSITPRKQKDGPVQEIFLKPSEKCIYIRNNKAITLRDDNNNNSQPVQKPDSHQDAGISHVVILQNINTEQEKLWKDGNLIFRDETFNDLATELERWYDVKIHFVDEKIRNYKFTGKFDKETINQAMEALKLSSQESYQYNIVYRDIYLKSK